MKKGFAAYRAFDERCLDGLLHKHGNEEFLLLAAARGDCGDAAALKREIKALGCSFVPVYASFGGDGTSAMEEALYVLPFPAVYDRGRACEAASLAETTRRLGRGIFAIRRPGEAVRCCNDKENAFGALCSEDVSLTVLTKGFLTALHGQGEADGLFMAPPPGSLMDAHRRAMTGELVDMSGFFRKKD